jgi:hypothetical protein
LTDFDIFVQFAIINRNNKIKGEEDLGQKD